MKCKSYTDLTKTDLIVLCNAHKKTIAQMQKRIKKLKYDKLHLKMKVERGY